MPAAGSMGPKQCLVKGVGAFDVMCDLNVNGSLTNNPDTVQVRRLMCFPTYFESKVKLKTNNLRVSKYREYTMS